MKKMAILLLSLAFMLCACGQGELTIGGDSTKAPELALEHSFAEEELPGLKKLEYSGGYTGVSLHLPEGWEGEVVEFAGENQSYGGIEFWHSAYPEQRLKLHQYGGMFGVCGTGLRETEGELPGTGKYRVGFYDGREVPDFISFYDSPGGYALINGADAVWTEHGAELEKILTSIIMDQGIIRRSLAESIAKESVDVSYDYIRAEFDAENGIWTLSFTQSGGEAAAVVRLDAIGNMISLKNSTDTWI